jgi:L-lysine exporter family protein LysE/ArgO
MSDMDTPFFTGLATGAGLIVAIGAENAFVLTQGLRKQYRFTVALVCSIIDALLIGCGVAGMGTLIGQSPGLLKVAAGGGALFLLVYGLGSLRSALRGGHGMEGSESAPASRGRVVLSTLAIAVLNPHVYLDTVVLLGGIGATFPGEGRYLFGAGAILASFLWFFLLAYGSGFLAPLFRKPLTWRIFDGLIFLVMWTIAFKLLSFSGILGSILA